MGWWRRRRFRRRLDEMKPIDLDALLGPMLLPRVDIDRNDGGHWDSMVSINLPPDRLTSYRPEERARDAERSRLRWTDFGDWM